MYIIMTDRNCYGLNLIGRKIQSAFFRSLFPAAFHLLLRLFSDRIVFEYLVHTLQAFHHSSNGFIFIHSVFYKVTVPLLAVEEDLLIEHLRLLKDGNPVDAPSDDFASHARTDAARHIDVVPVCLVEGMLIMCDPELRGLFDLTVFMDADADVRALRRIVRDCRERGADLERAVDMYLGTCKPAHERYVEPCKAMADIVIEDALQDASVEAVVERIERLL